jgi:hypothetical protein
LKVNYTTKPYPMDFNAEKLLETVIKTMKENSHIESSHIDPNKVVELIINQNLNEQK